MSIPNGGLANEPRFLGTATSEITSATNTQGGWNSDRTRSVSAASTYVWFLRSDGANTAADAGVFAYYGWNGFDTNANISHRTILLGY